MHAADHLDPARRHHRRLRVVFYGADVPTGIAPGRSSSSSLVGASFSALGLAITADHPERRRGPADRQRDHPAAAVPVGIFIPLGRRAAVDQDRERHLPGQALRRRDAGVVLRPAALRLLVVDVPIVAAWGLVGLVLRSASSRGSRASEAVGAPDGVEQACARLAHFTSAGGSADAQDVRLPRGRGVAVRRLRGRQPDDRWHRRVGCQRLRPGRNRPHQRRPPSAPRRTRTRS